jgi:hypothetical protein
MFSLANPPPLHSVRSSKAEACHVHVDSKNDTTPSRDAHLSRRIIAIGAKVQLAPYQPSSHPVGVVPCRPDPERLEVCYPAFASPSHVRTAAPGRHGFRRASECGHLHQGRQRCGSELATSARPESA